ncbi:MAG: HAMP domain-containing histidine kinase [Anaerolineae bacterium]|nr:HAMP domain-containing histidine kinase [Anaerolineae bacterium]
MKLTSIRARLLFGSVGVLCAGFIVLMVIAGAQISSAARADFEYRLQNEIQLIAQGIRSELRQDDRLTDDEQAALIAEYEGRTHGEITLYTLDMEGGGAPRGGGSDDGGAPRSNFRDAPEMETALRGDTVVVERNNEQGNPALYTAAGINSQPPVLVQLSVPLANLQTVIFERWALLWLLFGAVLVAAVIASVLLARSIIRPLTALKQSAHQLAAGDFSSRVEYTRDDEIGEVAHAFNEMAHQVESMLEEQRAFAANTSHELRTPLTTIRLRSEALRYEEGVDAGTLKQYISEIDDEAQRMGTLIEDLTVLARFDAGRAELGSDAIDFALLAASLQRRIQPHADAKRIGLVVNVPTGLPPVRASLNHLTVVFRNLLDNAIKYTPEGGVVTWTARTEDGGICSIISDTGRGVEPEQIPKLFERFYRVDKARSREIPGSGLGLAIVKSIIDAYGATIRIESAGKDRGTAVTVWWKGQTNGL